MDGMEGFGKSGAGTNGGNGGDGGVALAGSEEPAESDSIVSLKGTKLLSYIANALISRAGRSRRK